MNTFSIMYLPFDKRFLQETIIEALYTMRGFKTLKREITITLTVGTNFRRDDKNFRKYTPKRLIS